MRPNALRAKIVENGMTVGDFCKTAGFVRSTFDRKINGDSEFNRDELERIMVALNLSSDEMRSIFFADDVA